MQIQQQILQLFPEHLRFKWKACAQLGEQLLEIRLRVGLPVILVLEKEEVFMTETGCLSGRMEEAQLLDRQELEQILKHLCRYSFYAYEEEMRKGFVSTNGGFRVGIAGEVFLDAQGCVKNIRHISSINIRIAHEKKGIAKPLLKWLYQDGRLLNILLVSPPGCGKTTLLRDIIRMVSDGNDWAEGLTVGVVDERSEIAGCVQGIARKDLGKRTDVLDGCPKAEGMYMLLRSMAPRVVAVDELGGEADVRALTQVLKCGCSILATIHGDSFETLYTRAHLQPLFREQIFDRILILQRENGNFLVQHIYDAQGSILSGKLLC